MAMSLMHQWHDTICGSVIGPRHSLLYGAYGCILAGCYTYLSKDGIEEDVDADVLADIEVDAATAEATVYIDVEAGVDAGIGIEVSVEGEDEDEHEAESSNRGTIEVGVDVVAGIDIPVGSSTSLESSVFTEAEGEPVPNPRDGSLGRKARNDRGAMHVTRECTYHDFVKCQPLNFKGSEGVVRLTRWFEKMETVFHSSNCPEKYQVKYATSTLLNSALTWWNSHKRTIGADDAFSMSWRELIKLMIEVYCPRNEIQKMKTELWNLTEKGNDLTAFLLPKILNELSHV
ncbi:reverse transcriptase domain-containing protein [Tanacetum coccineum]